MREEVIRKARKRAGVFIVFRQNSPATRDTVVGTRIREERRPVANSPDNRCSFARHELHGRRTPDKARARKQANFDSAASQIPAWPRLASPRRHFARARVQTRKWPNWLRVDRRRQALSILSSRRNGRCLFFRVFSNFDFMVLKRRIYATRQFLGWIAPIVNIIEIWY